MLVLGLVLGLGLLHRNQVLGLVLGAWTWICDSGTRACTCAGDSGLEFVLGIEPLPLPSRLWRLKCYIHLNSSASSLYALLLAQDHGTY